MRDLALLSHVYNAQSAVDGQLQNWRALPPDALSRLEFLLVDDCSDTPLQVAADGLPLRAFRIISDIPWNMAGAKNLLRSQAQAPWLLFFDIDNHLAAAHVVTLLSCLPNLDPQTTYLFQRNYQGQSVDPHINTFLVHRTVLDNVGGFDEDFCGHYGFEDVYFHKLLVDRGLNRILLVDLPFEQGSARTGDLDRDMERNRALLNQKVSQNTGVSAQQLRFEWMPLPGGLN